MTFKAQLVERNKGDNEVRSQQYIKRSPYNQADLHIEIPERQQEVIFQEDMENKRILEIKSKYDAQIIAHERTERRLEDAESLLEQEREKNVQLRQELLKSLDIEKNVKKYKTNK